MMRYRRIGGQTSAELCLQSHKRDRKEYREVSREELLDSRYPSWEAALLGREGRGGMEVLSMGDD